MTLSVDNSDRDYVDDDDEFEEWFKRNYGKDKEEEPEQEKPEESVVKFTEADVDLAADNASEAVRRMIEAFNNAERSVWGATIEPGRTELGSSLDPDSNKSNDGTVLNNSKKNSSKLTRRRSRSQERKGQGNPDDSSDEDKENAESREDGYSSGSDSFDDNIDTRSAAGKSSSSVPPPAYVNSSGMPTPAGGGTEFSLNIVSSFDIYGMSDESKDADGNKNPFSSKVPMPRRINSEQNSGRAREDSYEDNTEVVSRLLPEHVPKIKSSSSPSTPISRKSAFQRSFSFSEERTKESACITDEERAGQDSVDVNKKILKKSYSEPIQVKMNGYEEPSDSMSSPNESFPVSDGGDGNATHSPNRKKITVEQISTFKRLHRMYSSGEIQNEEEDDKEDDEEDDPGAGSIMDEFNSIGSTLAGWIDRGWRSNRDYKLLRTSLDIENPSLSEKMTRYLLQDYVIEVFISFITLLDRKWTPSKGPCARPKREDPVTDELKRSYRATMLLAHDTPSENLQSIIKAKGDIMVQELLKGFQSNSCANLHHVTHLLSSLLNCIPDVVLHFIGRNKRDGDLYFTFIINNLDNGAVLDFFISLVLAENCVEENVRNAFNYSLSEWGLLQNLQERMVHPEISDELATSISDAISYLVPALTSDPHGAPLLMPLAEPVMIQSLVECATNISCSVERRVASLRVCINVVGMERLRYLEATTPSEMVNNMSDILPIIHKNLQRNFSILRDSICRENDPCASSSSTFSYWRFLIVTLMVEMHVCSFLF
uniref:Uncharacterized protein n=1 Tax=Corethron hystrix TaxID=216773 RepID=A0A7S1B5C2_9STRA|mmetsp:Transcript_13243/g.29167  ORF Transcript_13243/g.29167 Transcript_13243/m.29167 type:complete len:770 (+) Transcript_13243:267-2576(+)